MGERKRYSNPKGRVRDFKDLAISQILQRPLGKDGISVAELSRRYEISDKTIQQWKTNVMPINPDGPGKKVPLQTFKRIHAEIFTSLLFLHSPHPCGSRK